MCACVCVLPLSNHIYFRYEKAAKDGHSGALCNLGVLYAMGKGVTKDRKRAVQFYQAAAAQENAAAQFNLAAAHACGSGGLEVNLRQAAELYQKVTWALQHPPHSRLLPPPQRFLVFFPV